jgi:DNA-directed RNA polymerase subunit RPC12/RpoP
MKIIFYILAAITIFFGVLFIWGAFDPSSPDGWIIVGVISVAIGLGLIWLAGRQKAKAGDTNVTVNVDLPSTVSMDTFKCQSCGGALTPENVKLVAGAPVVTCPYCNTSYQLKEEPKW